MNFNSCLTSTPVCARLTDFVFVSMANTILLRRDSYLSYLKAGVKADTLNALRSGPLELDTLFPDSVIKQEEEDIANFDRNRSGWVYKRADTIPMKDRTENLSPRNRTDRPGRMFPHTASIDEGRANTSIPHDQPRASSRINDNYCVTKPQARLLAGSTPKETLTVQSLKRHVKLNVVNHVP